MLNKIIASSLKNRFAVVIISLIIAFLGFYLSKEMSIDVLPDLNKPTVTVMTEAHAMVPEDVEKLVTRPLEQSLNGAANVERITSSSGLGLSVIKVEFNWGSDIYRNRQIVMEKLQLAKSLLPDDIEPEMQPISSIMGQVQIVGISSKSGKSSIEEIRALADYQLKYDIMGLPGVSKVVVMGGSPKQLQVIIDVDKLNAFDVTILEIEEAIKKSNLNRSGGFIDINAKAPYITVTGLLESEKELEQVVVKEDPIRPTLIKDLAKVTFGPAKIKTGDAGVGGKPAVVMVIMKAPGFDTAKLTESVDTLLEDAAKNNQDLEFNTSLFRQADFIHRAIDNVMEAIRDGGIMVIIVLFLFLLNWRTSFITLTAIPISIAITAIAFAAMGLSINTMTLGGLAVAIGALVDDAIVDVENVYRRLVQNRDRDNPLPAFTVIYNASSEVRKPIVIGSLLVIIVYIPLFFLTGMEGKLFTPIGIAYIISVAASLFVALTLTPALCYFLLPNKLPKKEAGETFVVRHLKNVAGFFIKISMKYAVIVILGLAGTVGIAIYFLINTGSQFLPAFNEGVLQVNMVLPPDTGLKASNEYGIRLEKMLSTVDGVNSVVRRTGRAQGDEHAEGVNTSEFILTFDPDSKRHPEEIKNEIRSRTKDEFPGIATALDQPLSHLLSHMLSGVKAQVAIKVFGPDLEELRSIAKDVEAAIKPVDGVKDLMIEPQVLIPNIEINPNRESLAKHSLSVADIGETIELAMGGEAVSKLIQGRYSFPIILSIDDKDRKTLDDIANLYIKKPQGELIPLEDVATIRPTLTSNNINHENVGRRIVIQHNIANRSLSEVVSDIDSALDKVRSKISSMDGYSLTISGQFEAQEKASKRILILSILSLLLMTLILYMHFKSINLSLQVLASIPMAFIGAVLFIVVTQQTVSVATLVGLISLGGIAARNAILLLDHYIHLVKEEGYEFSKEMIIKAGQERMVPVMMTALTSGIALIPLILAPDDPGKEILYPVATVIIGGLISSTLLDFIVRPAIFWLFGRKAVEKVVCSEEE